MPISFTQDQNPQRNMKNSLVVVLLISALFNCSIGNSQPVLGIGMSYMQNYQVPAANLLVGFTFGQEKTNGAFNDLQKQKQNLVYMTYTISLNSRSDIPKLFALRYGRNIDNFQPYIGYAYHMGSHDKVNDPIQGFKPDYGLVYYPKVLSISFMLGRSGNVNTISLLIYTVK